MSASRMIEIDLDVHRKLEASRINFTEAENDILRRLLDLGPKQKVSAFLASIGSKGRSWYGDGVTLRHGTELRMTYNGVAHEGKVIDGKWEIEGRRYESPSGAASGVARTRAGDSPKLDGWRYWFVKRSEDDDWVPLNSLRLEDEKILKGDF